MSPRNSTLTLVRSSSPSASGPSHSLAKGIAAGLVGGLAAMAVRSYLKQSYAPRVQRQVTLELPPGESADHSMVVRRRPPDYRALRWGLSAAAGAAYGAVAEYYPAATSKEGASFGLALGALSQDGPLTAIGLMPPSESTFEKATEMTSFVIFGVITEAVRRIVRKLI